MTTTFFQRQEHARTRTVWLVILFVIAVIGIVATTTGLASVVLEFQRESNPEEIPEPFPWEIVACVGAGTLLVIALGSVVKILMLRAGGGSSVAEGLGGKRIFPDSNDADERRVLNIVEEMAIASGIPVPPVFLLSEENNINAFAAGYSPKDAVIGVTRGAVRSLTRDQLQGVIAHEFSHILNGDMRLGIRLIGILNGILLLGLIGRALFRIFAYARPGRSSSSDKNSGGVVVAILAVAVALIIVGAVGALIGNLIKAAVSRQREFLADASAVQFTRNPKGLSGALRRIASLVSGSPTAGSQIEHASAAEASHLYFAQGITGGFASLFSTHPPLPDRIRAIDPQWDGSFGLAPDEVNKDPHRSAAVEPTRSAAQSYSSPAGMSAFAGSVDGNFHAGGHDSIAISDLHESVEKVGEPTREHQQYARELNAAIPSAFVDIARSPYAARALVFALLMDRDSAVFAAQVQSLQGTAEPHLVELTQQLAGPLAQLDARLRLPLVDLVIPALCAMSASQYHAFEKSFRLLIAADQKLDLFEWTLSQVIARHLRCHYQQVPSPRTLYYGLQRVGPQLSTLLSTLAHVGHSEHQSQQAFEVASTQLKEAQLDWLPIQECTLQNLDAALTALAAVAPKLKQKIILACSECVCADGHVRPAEAELLRGIADLLDCPMPPVLPGQKVRAAI